MHDGCWIKSATESTEHYSHPGRTACKKGKAAPYKPLYTMKGAVPGDLITDLQRAGMIGDPLYELNWLNSSLWDEVSWQYSTSFEMAEHEVAAVRAGTATRLIVFDGIKMGASISLNGQVLGQANDQFLRYRFEVPAQLLVAGANTLTVKFDGIDCDGRWMACTGGWDWAPYTNTQSNGIQSFTKGIWKSVYTVQVANVAITAVVPQISYAGAYPTTPLVDGAHGGFDVLLRVHIWAPKATSVDVSAVGAWSAGDVVAASPIAVPAGDSEVRVALKATAAQVKLWWPAGHGAQPLCAALPTPAAAHGTNAPPPSGTMSPSRRRPAAVPRSWPSAGSASASLRWSRATIPIPNTSRKTPTPMAPTRTGCCGGSTAPSCGARAQT